MQLHASYKPTKANTYAMTVSVSGDDLPKTPHAGCMLTVEDEVNADRLTQALRQYAKEPTPTNMHWVSARLRSLSSRDRKAVLRVLDCFAGGGHE